MLVITEDQSFDLNSGARQRLLALEQLGFTLFTPSAWAPKVGLAA
jgi:hypothetical protein